MPAERLSLLSVNMGGAEEMRHLVSALSSESDMTLTHSIRLGGTEVPSSATLHGRLSPSGFMRKRYWDSMLREKSTWTSGSRVSDLAKVFLQGASELENKLQDTRKLDVGDFVVFRQGRSFAETKHTGLPADVYLSHFWGQPCSELLTILRQHAQVHFQKSPCSVADPSYWICTFANNQHKVDLGSHWKESPFYRGMQSLRETGGSVLMAMDLVASTLTRIPRTHVTQCLRIGASVGHDLL